LSDQTESAVLERSWRLVAGHGPDGPVRAARDHPISLVIQGERWAGSAGCNHYTTTVAHGGERLAVPHTIATTLMACLDDVMDAERAYLAALMLVETIALADGRLTLRGRDVELVFEPTAAPGTDDPPVAPLFGTDWAIVALRAGGRAVPEQPVVGHPRLHLAEDGTVTGSTGCNRFMGRYQVTGSKLTVGRLATTRMACDEPAASQEALLLQVLSDATVAATVSGDTLRLSGQAGAVVELRRGDLDA
jgi:heat shock protein HslJ